MDRKNENSYELGDYLNHKDKILNLGSVTGEGRHMKTESIGHNDWLRVMVLTCPDIFDGIRIEKKKEKNLMIDNICIKSQGIILDFTWFSELLKILSCMSSKNRLLSFPRLHFFKSD